MREDSKMKKCPRRYDKRNTTFPVYLIEKKILDNIFIHSFFLNTFVYNSRKGNLLKRSPYIRKIFHPSLYIGEKIRLSVDIVNSMTDEIYIPLIFSM